MGDLYAGKQTGWIRSTCRYRLQPHLCCAARTWHHTPSSSNTRSHSIRLKSLVPHPISGCMCRFGQETFRGCSTRGRVTTHASPTGLLRNVARAKSINHIVAYSGGSVLYKYLMESMKHTWYSWWVLMLFFLARSIRCFNNSCQLKIAVLKSLLRVKASLSHTAHIILTPTMQIIVTGSLHSHNISTTDWNEYHQYLCTEN